MTEPDSIEKVRADELTIGRKVKFPNSRGFQEVEQIVANAGSVTLIAGDAQWVVPPHFETNAERLPEGQADEEEVSEDGE